MGRCFFIMIHWYAASGKHSKTDAGSVDSCHLPSLSRFELEELLRNTDFSDVDENVKWLSHTFDPARTLSEKPHVSTPSSLMKSPLALYVI
jgi:hypothetical protein